MKICRILTATLFFLFYLVSCNNQNAGNIKKGDKDSSNIPETVLLRTGLQVEPLLLKADSLQVLYFDEPYGDSLRYTRFFRYVTIKDTLLVKKFIHEFDKIYRDTYIVDKECRSEGKIIAYTGSEPVKTIFFATGEFKRTPCKYLYFIKNGIFYYFPVSDDFASVINEYKRRSKAP